MSAKIKKINTFKSFCGLDNVVMNDDFKDYNVIFANNGTGKTSITRAFELLIKDNYKNILKYQSIDSHIEPKISFRQYNDNEIIVDNDNINPQPSFDIEIYNSDFLVHNAPLGSEYGLKKLDDKTIVLEGSYIGEESKEIEDLKSKISQLEEDKISIEGEPGNLDESEISRLMNNNVLQDVKVEKIRKHITSTAIQISNEDLKIDEIDLSDDNNFTFSDNKLQELQNEFDEFNTAYKSFESLHSITTIPFKIVELENGIKSLFSFDLKNEAGKVSENIEQNIINIGRKWIEEGIEKVDNAQCPFCMQEITNGILEDYTSIFNESVKKFSSETKNIIDVLISDIDNIKSKKNQLLLELEAFKPFLDNFETKKHKYEEAIDNIVINTRKICDLLEKKEGINNFDKYLTLYNEIKKENVNFKTIISLTESVLEDKKTQKLKFDKLKRELKSIKIMQVKKETFLFQKQKKDNNNKIIELKGNLKDINEKLAKYKPKLHDLKNQSRPDTKVINDYLKTLNLIKYSVDSEYRITINQEIVNFDNLKIVLSEGEKTTIAFAYFLARLKLFYNKNTLKNLVIIIDDPISSLDEERIYTTSYLVSKINQEIAGEILDRNDEKAQVFVFTHSHIFMTNIIRTLGKAASYFQLSRNHNTINIEYKSDVAGYFDTFFMLLFSEVYKFSKEENPTDDYERALNNGNKIRILLESFIKTNFISEFIKKEYREQQSFSDAVIQSIIDKILDKNNTFNFSVSHYQDTTCAINCKDDLKIKLGSVVKGLHMDSHGSIVDFYAQHKSSLIEVQQFAKIAINVMLSLNPNQVYSYIDAVQE